MIELRSKTLRATVTTYGAALTGLWVKGTPHSLVLGSCQNSDYQGALTYFGALVGPIANRIGGAQVQIDGRRYELDANEGSTCLHSGSSGLHRQTWAVTAQSESAITMQCHMKDGQGGLPGNRDIRVRYTAYDDGTLSLKITATSDKTTVMNIAHHPYWNLDGAPTVKDHQLEIAASEYTPVTSATLPNGQTVPVKGTAFDFATPRHVPTDKSLDANFCLAGGQQEKPRIAAILSAPGAPVLTLRTTEPGLQLYNSAGLGPANLTLHDREYLGPYAGIALEPQGWPDAPNQPTFPSIALTPHDMYRQITEYRFS